MSKNSSIGSNATNFIHDIIIFQIIVGLFSAFIFWLAFDRTIVNGVEAVLGWLITFNISLLVKIAYGLNFLIDKVNTNTTTIEENSKGIEVLYDLSKSNRLQNQVPGIKERQKDILKHLRGLASGIVYVDNRWDMYEQDILNIDYITKGSGSFKATVPISIKEYQIQLTEDGFKRFMNKQFEVRSKGIVVQRLYLLPDDLDWEKDELITKHFNECLKQKLELKVLQLKNSQIEHIEDIVIFNNSRVSTSKVRNESLFKTAAIYTSDKDELRYNIQKFETLWSNPETITVPPNQCIH